MIFKIVKNIFVIIRISTPNTIINRREIVKKYIIEPRITPIISCHRISPPLILNRAKNIPKLIISQNKISERDVVRFEQEKVLRITRNISKTTPEHAPQILMARNT